MGKIKVLPPQVREKIAAGEVVEGPFSVVKELVENSLDAGATKIEVWFKEGGKTLIAVRDNGEGMSYEDLLECWKPHTTSKVESIEDIYKGNTLGFRGEALFSICRVSDTLIESGNGAEGGRIRVRDGRMVMAERLPPFKGTKVEVKELFLNLPVRRKLLGSARMESARILSVLNGYVMAYPGVEWVIKWESEVRAYRAESLPERIEKIIGYKVKLLETRKNGINLKVFLPDAAVPVSEKKIYVFVNGRPVEIRRLKKFTSSFPVLVVFIELSCGLFDPNIHPAKKEVLIKVIDEVETLLKALLDASYAAYPADPFSTSAVMEAIADYMQAGLKQPRQPSLVKADKKSFRVLGQVFDSYIIVEKEGYLLIIDQEKATYRINYDRLVPKRFGYRLTSPITIYDRKILRAVEENIESLQKAGFEVEILGKTAIFRSVPFKEISESELVEYLKNLGEEDISEMVRKSLARRKAVKKGRKLDVFSLENIVNELFKSSNPRLSPDGQLVFVSFDSAKVASFFRKKYN